MNKSTGKLIKKSKNDVNYFNKLKNRVNISKLFYAPRVYQKYLISQQLLIYELYNKKITTKKIKISETFTIVPAMLNDTKMKHNIKNLVINHLTIEFYFYYYADCCDIHPVMQLTMLIYLLNFMNIKRLTLHISIYRCSHPTYDLFCKYLRYVLQKYCKDMRIDINYKNSSYNFITKLGDGINVIKEDYATINKFRTNYHRTFKLKHRIA